MAIDGNTSGQHGYPCRDQIGRSQDSTLSSGTTGPWASQALTPAYSWNNRQSSTAYGFVSYSGCANETDYHAKLDRDYYNENASFNGTSGVGIGVLASMPATCTTGVGYWATDQGNWNKSGSGGQGVLYKCTATNTWTSYYTPYEYPHPLIAGESPTLPTLSSITIGTNGTSWTFAYSENVTCSTTSHCCDDYTAAMTTAGAVALSYASGSTTSSVVCTGDVTVYAGDTVANGGVDYTTRANGIEDDEGDDLASFTNKALTNNSTQDNVDPVLSNLTPSGDTTYGTTKLLSLNTSEASTCRYHASSTTWGDMSEMSSTGGTTHTQTVNVSVGANAFKVVCQDTATNESDASTWSFTVATQAASEKCIISIGTGSQTISGGGTQTIILQ